MAVVAMTTIDNAEHKLRVAHYVRIHSLIRWRLLLHNKRLRMMV